MRELLRKPHLGIAAAGAKCGGAGLDSRTPLARSGIGQNAEAAGRNQAVRIPRQFEPPSEEAAMRKEGGQPIVEPKGGRTTLAEVLALLEPLDEPFPEFEDYPPEPVVIRSDARRLSCRAR